jgi:hypothetical protein
MWLDRWRDWAVILLAVESACLAALLGVALFYALRGLRWLNVRSRPILFRTRLYVWKGTRLANSAIATVLAPFVWLQCFAAGLGRALSVLLRR